MTTNIVVAAAGLNLTHLFAVPVIAVFTKYDELIGRANFEIDPIRIDGLSNERILTIAKDDAQKKLQAECIEPFEKRVGDKVPHVTVSSKSFGFLDVLN